jgi:hypothetical protein
MAARSAVRPDSVGADLIVFDDVTGFPITLEVGLPEIDSNKHSIAWRTRRIESEFCGYEMRRIDERASARSAHTLNPPESES